MLIKIALFGVVIGFALSSWVAWREMRENR